ncbi:hypothetical protein IP81_15710 [Novosphingobium sp. AAP83]|nr:hypothetical protein IP81_15710 [Novosphingobium sp. AAP83]
MLSIIIIPAFLLWHFSIKESVSNRIWLLLLFSAVAMMIIFVVMTNPNRIVDFVAYDRLSNLAYENDSSLEVRGYSLYFEGTFFEKIFGISSFEAWMRHDGAEVHSTFMAPLTYYGFIGGAFFLSIFYFWIRGCKESFGWIGALSICLPPILYGITHNGGRFSLLWILMAFSLAIKPKGMIQQGVGQRVVPPTVHRNTMLQRTYRSA